MRDISPISNVLDHLDCYEKKIAFNTLYPLNLSYALYVAPLSLKSNTLHPKLLKL